MREILHAWSNRKNYFFKSYFVEIMLENGIYLYNKVYPKTLLYVTYYPIYYLKCYAKIGSPHIYFNSD